MINHILASALLCVALAFAPCVLQADRTEADRQQAADDAQGPNLPAKAEIAMDVHYLEIVTPDVKATCEAMATLHGISFSEPVAALGNARTAALEGGGRIGVRAPMRDTEEPVVRPYVLVEDINDAVEAARAAGAQIALPPMELPGEGTCAIYFLGGIEHGLWQR